MTANILLFQFCILACNSSPNSSLATTLSSYWKPGERTDTTIYVVIPNQGCEGCISEVESYVQTHAPLNTRNVVYIFTRIQSLKVLRFKLGYETLKLPNIKLDTANRIPFPDPEKLIYPMFVYTKNNKDFKIDYQSPQSNGLINLTNYIALHKY